MRDFKPTYLYVKIHNKTGLKYFGKTEKDPFKYKGSGKYWLNHLKVHGNDITTEIIGYYIFIEECVQAALNFSKENNIVKSTNWANMVEENGINGGHIKRNYFPMSNKTKIKLSESKKGQIPWNKGKKIKSNRVYGPLSEETKEKIRQANLDKKLSEETKSKISLSNKGKIVSEETKSKISLSNKGKIVSEETKEKHRNKKISEETKEKIRQANLGKKVSQKTKEKLKNFVIVVDKKGNISRIKKEKYWSQIGNQEDWEYVFHKSKVAQMRRN